MTERKTKSLSWQPAFLAALTAGKSVRTAAKAAGISARAVYWHRDRKPGFARQWDEAQGKEPDQVAPDLDAPRSAHWRRDFFEALAATSNVTASAARANVPVQTVYKERRTEAEFANKWRAALLEGYDLLEMELLGHLREPKPERKMDVAAAIRLLAAHRTTVERERALREEEDEQTVRESIDAFLEGIRQRRLAKEATLIEASASDVAE